MKVLCIGSMNLDFVYSVDHIVTEGETQASRALDVFPGGKGMNQSVALAKAGAEVYHAGLIGEDGKLFYNVCLQHGVNSRYIKITGGKTGHAIIQRDRDGQNSIILYGGANRKFTEEYVDSVLTDFENGDILLLQNEINMLPYIVDKAYEKGMRIVLNPSPFDTKLKAVDMGRISVFILNEIEGEQFTGCSEPDGIIENMLDMYPNAKIVLTLGENGAVYADSTQKLCQSAFKVQAVDTTAAGDTFTGYFIAALSENTDIANALKTAAKAASIAVTREGAVPSIPLKKEVEAALAGIKE